MAGLFSKPIDDFPTRDDEKIEEERRKRLLVNRNRSGRSSTILTGGGGLAPIETANAINTINALAVNTVLGG